MRVAALAVFVLATLFAGCSGDRDGASSTPPVTTITDPAQAVGNSTGVHLHDYWGASHRLALMTDERQPSNTILFTTEPSAVTQYHLPPQSVVPQGAAWVNVTVSWANDGPTGAAASTYDEVSLWVKSAADAEPLQVAVLSDPNGSTLAIPTTNAMDDLPHQVVSAWVFEVRMRGVATPATGVLRFDGSTTMSVTTDRGHDIPLFEGHPDRWGGAQSLPLFDVSQDVTFEGDPTTGNLLCIGGCPAPIAPTDGAIVPYDAVLVRVELTTTYDVPTTIGLKYHAADRLDFVVTEPSTTQGKTRVYEIPVDNRGDGPYALQSQWAFLIHVNGPVNDTLANESYRLVATAQRTATA